MYRPAKPIRLHMTGWVGFAGDWHGNEAWSCHGVETFARLGVDTVYHLGDFGLWPGREGKFYLERLHKTCAQFDVRLFITLGNHEDYDRVAVMQTDEDGWLFLKNYPLFRFAPRGHVWCHSGAVFASMGGAGSVDIHHRTPGKSWWAQEAIVPADVDALTANMAAAGVERVDVMLTHDAPAGVHRRGMMPRPRWITEEVEKYCHDGRVVLAEGVEVARPRVLLHGHWHDWYDDQFEGAGFVTKVWGLPDDGNWRNLAVGEPTAGVGLTDFGFAIPRVGTLAFEESASAQ